MKYRFITNFKPENIDEVRIALQAVEITGYKFCKTAKDAYGNILPDYYALYFDETVTEKEKALFYRAYSMVIIRVLEKQEGEKQNG